MVMENKYGINESFIFSSITAVQSSDRSTLLLYVDRFCLCFDLSDLSYVPFQPSRFLFIFIFSVSLPFLKRSLSRPLPAYLSIFTFLVLLPSSISPIWLLPRFKSIDFLPTCLSRLSVGLPVVRALLSVCPPASLHLTVCLSSVFVSLPFLFLSSCLWACTGSDSVSLSSSPLSSTPCHTHTHTNTPPFSSSPSDNVDYYLAIWISLLRDSSGNNKAKIGRSLKSYNM